jgi:hypothetical protein
LLFDEFHLCGRTIWVSKKKPKKNVEETKVNEKKKLKIERNAIVAIHMAFMEMRVASEKNVTEHVRTM